MNGIKVALGLGVWLLAWGGTVQAQVAPGDMVPSAQEALSDTGLDDITNQPDQLMTWVCEGKGQTIAAEVKETANWQALLGLEQDWQCTQQVPTIPDGSPSFSCEPNTAMGLLTVFWMEGDGGPAQMKTWMNTLANEQNWVCTRSQSNPFWE